MLDFTEISSSRRLSQGFQEWLDRFDDIYFEHQRATFCTNTPTTIEFHNKSDVFSLEGLGKERNHHTCVSRISLMI